jgi:hypothetical protein
MAAIWPLIAREAENWATLANLPRHKGRSKALGLVADTLGVAGLGFGHGL